MPEITGQTIVILTVSNVVRSAKWYCDLLGMQERGRYSRPDGHIAQVFLVEPRTGLPLCLVDHAGGPDSFDERRVGLDHLEFLVASRSDLDAWTVRLDELAIAHSGVREPPRTSNAMITFRDPDNVQLEFFWRAPPARPVVTPC